MKLLIKLAWRNLFRNTRRTVLTGLLIGIGLAALMFCDALMVGMIDTMIRSATQSFLGHAQIHEKSFRKAMELEKTIHNLPEIIQKLEKEIRIEKYTIRLQSFAMISSSANVSSVFLYGVDPAREAAFSKVAPAIQKGKFLSPEGSGETVIGYKLAKLLEVEIGDRLVVTVSQSGTGDLSQEPFRVRGIFNMGQRSIDNGIAFISIKDSRRLLALPNQAHEIAIQFKDIRLASDKNLDLWAELSEENNEALGWNSLLPSLDSVIKMSDFSIWIIGVILFGVISLGVINTLFMSIYERMFEFGVLKAIGTRALQSATLILFEAGSLAILASIIGIILGTALNLYFSKYGMDFSGIEYAGITWQDPIFTPLRWKQYISFPIVVFFLTLIAALYPAIYAARIVPAEAMRKSL